MRKSIVALLLFFALLGSFSAQAQILKPVKWAQDVSQREVKVGDEVELIFKATIDKDWYLYSTDFSKDLGPKVTEFIFEKHKSYALVGDVIPMKPKKKYDDLWGGEYTYFVGTGEFRQKVKILATDVKILVTADYQSCTEIDGRCIPLEEEFEFTDFTVTGGEAASTAETTPAETAVSPEDTENTEAPESEETETPDENSAETETAEGTEVTESATNASEENTETVKAEATNTTAGGEKEEKESLLGFMLAAFLAGIAALLTPCVFPMIPMTVSFFTHQSKDRAGAIGKGLLFGFSIIGIYTLIGLLVAKLVGPEAANFMATHWIPNAFFFAIFLVFAISFFGAFEIVLPSSMVNAMDKKADQGGIMGVFFMAFTLALVSFSCTGPIVGTILVESANGQLLRPIAGMFSFSLAFAIPFSLFAIFPGWLSNLPRSGGWLNTVKVVLGFIELALALKFLSIIDQVYHLGILDREVNIAMWMAISVGLGIYLLGFIQLPHDSPVEKVSVTRLIFALVSFSFFFYLLPGMFGAPLKMLSGYLPPQATHDFDLNKVIRDNMQGASFSGTASHGGENLLDEPKKYADFLHLPHGLNGYFDYEQGLKAAKKAGKPLFIDFTGHGCVNCREMEANVWVDPEVLKRLREDFVIAALYVDDKTELPEDEWVVSEYDGKTKKTIGKKFADQQITRFNNNAQPFYVILDHNGELLVPPHAYDLDVSKFVEFLDAAKENFKK